MRLAATPRSLAESYVREFLDDLAALNVLPATAYPRATETMDEILRFISDLIASDHAYEAAGDVYFRVAKRQPIMASCQAASARICSVARASRSMSARNQPADFALWKAAKGR